MAYNEDSSASGHDEPWIQWFCGLKGHEMFCEVERSYIEDGFNLYGLRACVTNFSDCLDLILDRIGPDDSDDSHLTQSACTLYGLIHARYIITAHGLDAMYNKYASKEFGTCPLVQCQGQPVLPLGLKDEVGYDSVKVFCPKCQCVYHPPPPRRGGTGAVDGAAFGTTFAHLFLMTFNNLVPEPLSPDSLYVPRVFGFRVHSSTHQRPIASSQISSSNINSGKNGKRSEKESISAAAAAPGVVASSGVGDTNADSKIRSQGMDKGENTAALGMNPPQSNHSSQDTVGGVEHGGPTTAQHTPGENAVGLNPKAEGECLAKDAAPSENGDVAAVEGPKMDENGDSKEFSQSQDESALDSSGKAGLLQAKRRGRGASGSPMDTVNANGISSMDALKTSKRQKRPGNAVGT